MQGETRTVLNLSLIGVMLEDLLNDGDAQTAPFSNSNRESGLRSNS